MRKFVNIQCFIIANITFIKTILAVRLYKWMLYIFKDLKLNKIYLIKNCLFNLKH